MFFKKIFLYNFRNISSLKTELFNKYNLFIGKNGQGKSNILEAIYLASNGHGFRPISGVESFINKNTKEQKAFIKLIIQKQEEEGVLTTEINAKKKVIFLMAKRMQYRN